MIATAISAGTNAAETSAARAGRPRPERGPAIAVLPLTGVITPRGSLLSSLFGDGPGGLDAFRADFRAALADDEIGGILIDVDSPGGSTDLVTETAAEIRAARGTKPIVASANTDAASAAYWIASQADEVHVTPSGAVGSVGVFALHIDESRAMDSEGFTPTFISAGKFKTEGNPLEPLSEEARDYAQANVDGVYDQFLEDVAAGRGVTPEAVRKGFGEGRMVNADDAVAEGMADRVSTIEESAIDVLGRVRRLGRRRSSAKASNVSGVEDDQARTDDGKPASQGGKIRAEALRALALAASVRDS